MTMIMVNIHEAKAKLSEYLEAAERGERVVICNRNRPIVELRRVETVERVARTLEPLFPDVKIPPSFFEPLPDDLLEAFSGGGPGPELAASRVAEDKLLYRTSKTRRRPKRS